jgi:hypothetical protein
MYSRCDIADAVVLATWVRDGERHESLRGLVRVSLESEVMSGRACGCSWIAFASHRASKVWRW